MSSGRTIKSIEAILKEDLRGWSNEALLKELLWAYHYVVINNLPLDNPYYVKILNEVDDRIMEKTGRIFVVDSLLEAQREISTHKTRNAELRKIEAILGIDTPIQDEMIP